MANQMCKIWKRDYENRIDQLKDVRIIEEELDSIGYIVKPMDKERLYRRVRNKKRIIVERNSFILANYFPLVNAYMLIQDNEKSNTTILGAFHFFENGGKFPELERIANALNFEEGGEFEAKAHHT